MFSLFENKRPKLTITDEDRKWVEENLLWLGEKYGIERLLTKPFIYPYYEDFPYKNLRNEEQYVPFFKKLCDIYNIDPNDFESYLFNKENAQWDKINKTSAPITPIEDSDVYKIYLNDNDFETIECTVALVVKHLTTYKLVKDNYYNYDDENGMDDFVALTAMYFGFGIFLANGNFVQSGRNKTVITYFPEQLMAYTNALICYISATGYEKVANLLSNNTRTAFKKNFLYLQTTNNTRLDKATINENIKLKELYSLIDTANRKKNYNAQIVAWDEVLKIKKDDWVPWNNLGYAKLMLGRFEEAIDDFNKALFFNHFAAFSLDNRAFCRLQMGNLERAFSDVVSSIDFDNQNAYTWRTLGIYHFLKQEYIPAIENLEKALKMDATTDLIHFYLAKVYGAMGDAEKQSYHNQKSVEANETTDDFRKYNRI